MLASYLLVWRMDIDGAAPPRGRGVRARLLRTLWHIARARHVPAAASAWLLSIVSLTTVFSYDATMLPCILFVPPSSWLMNASLNKRSYLSAFRYRYAPCGWLCSLWFVLIGGVSFGSWTQNMWFAATARRRLKCSPQQRHSFLAFFASSVCLNFQHAITLHTTTAT